MSQNIPTPSRTEFAPTPEQFTCLNAVNTAPKALAHIALPGDETPISQKEANQRFMNLQGSDPSWSVSRGYIRSVALSNACNGNTMIVDEHKELHLTDLGRSVARPAAAHLLIIADSFGVRVQTLIGDSTTPKERTSAIHLRIGAMQFLGGLTTSRQVTLETITNELACSPSASSGLVSEWTNAGFIVSETSARNRYAVYRNLHQDQEEVLQDEVANNDPLFSHVMESLTVMNGDLFDASRIAHLLGYNPKYIGKDVADILDIIETHGIIERVVDPQMRNKLLQLTPRGLNAFQAVLNVVGNIENPTTAFRRNGKALINIIENDSNMVKRSLDRSPTKRGQRRSTMPEFDRNTSAVISLVEKLAVDTPRQTSSIQEKITGTSRTATTRLLKEAYRKGLVDRVKIGREYFWTRRQTTTA